MYSMTGSSGLQIPPSRLASESTRNGQITSLNVENAITTFSYHAVPPPVNLNGNHKDSNLRIEKRQPQATPSQSNGLGSLPKDLISSNLTACPLHLSGATIDYSSDYLLVLLGLASPTETLRKYGYILQNLSEVDLNKKKRCQGCEKMMRSVGNHRSKRLTADQEMHQNMDLQEREASAQGVLEPIASASNLNPVYRCKYHPGEVRHKMWSCCHKHVSTDPCFQRESHVPRLYPAGQLENLWKFHATPAAWKDSDIRPAVAIDCEMGTAESGDCELIRITLIDYFSSVVLVDSLVYPDVKMAHYNTRFSGITRRDMNTALAKGKCFRGKDKAREAVWQFVAPHTVVVGHSANNDLTAMRWVHQTVVDTFILESKIAEDLKAVVAQEKELPTFPADVVTDTALKDRQAPRKRQKGSGMLSLKTLSMSRLGREIQTNERRGHDSLEDAVAARDLAHWHVIQSLGTLSNSLLQLPSKKSDGPA